MGVIKVLLVKANNIADKDFIGKTDPYVKISLEQDNVFRDVDHGYQKSSVKQGDLNPVWNETFEFNNINTLDNMVLTFQIYDSDVGSKDDKCGKCKIKLEHEDITSSPKRFTKVIDRNLIKANGTITVDISYEA